MINGFKVITLCGSTRFKDEFLEAQKRLTLEGNIVISVGLFGHFGDDVVWTEGVKEMLDRQHLAKIDLADEIYVINVGGYIGDSTRREIAYAELNDKAITYLEECKKPSNYDNYTALG
jgi:FAD/FMN-containing dehydrogenase